MLLKRIRLENFRCFGEADFDLTEPGEPEKPLKVALIVGDNGFGKSAVLDGISAFFSALSGDYGGAPAGTDDIRQAVTESRVRVEWRERLWSTEDQAPYVIGDVLRIARDAIALEEMDAAQRLEFAILQGGPSNPAGLIVSFDVHRLLPPRAVPGPNTQDTVSQPAQLSLAPTISRDGKLRPRAQHLKQWLVNLDFLRAKSKADRNVELPLWDILRHALNTLLHPYTFVGIDERFQVLFQTPTGRIHLEALSDGFRSVFVVIAELLLRLSLATEDPTKVLEQEGVCLIDEIDAHLHPRWQANILPGLTAMFPNVQFIATTHSEIVVSTVEPRNVFRLERAADGETITAVRQDKRFHAPQRATVSVNREVFGAPPATAEPTWILDPPPETLHRFWERYSAEIPPQARVFVAEGKVLLDEVLDTHDRLIPGLEDRSGEAALFFINREPMAEWAHPCDYVLWPDEGQPMRLEHRWPPSEAIRLLPITPPPRP